MRETYIEQLAIMRDLNVGTYDTGKACMWFTVSTLRGNAMLMLTWEQARELLEGHDVSNLDTLEGHPCVVSVEDAPGSPSVKFVRLF